MPEYLSPGVYVEEVSSGIKPIEGVGTSTAAFVGRARKGPVNEPLLVTNPSQFLANFGDLHQDYFLGYGVNNFFVEGGTRCYVVRVFKPTDADEPTSDFARTPDDFTDGKLKVLAKTPGKWGNKIWVMIGDPAFDPNDPDNTIDPKFSLTILYSESAEPDLKEDIVEVFESLSMKEFTDNGQPNPYHVELQINEKSAYIEVIDQTEDTAPPANTDTPVQLEEGTDGLSLDAPTDFTGDAPGKGLLAFDTVDDINIVVIPGLFNSELTNAEARIASQSAMTYCEKRKDCFFIADSPDDLIPTEVLKYKQAQGDDFGTDAGSAFNSSYAALYYPWIKIFDPLRGKVIPFPPSSSIAGAYSATDIRRGVHKAPAGIVDGRLKTPAGITRNITKGEQDLLNPNGINVIRNFPDSGIVVWGARTITADPEWKYLNVRRLFLFLEESIDEGTQWVVFEPNDPVLWAKIVRNISAFLRIQWLEGKLVGNKPEEAFFVRCDSETNPQDSVDLGRVITVIGVAPSKPAEFVIFRIMQARPGEGA